MQTVLFLGRQNGVQEVRGDPSGKRGNWEEN